MFFHCIYNYGLFNCSINHRHSCCWNYRGCWHQACPTIASQVVVYTPSFHFTFPDCLLAEEWTSFAPAAALGHGSYLSGSLSGIKPQFPVTHHCIGSPLHYLHANRFASYSPLLATGYRSYRSVKSKSMQYYWAVRRSPACGSLNMHG